MDNFIKLEDYDASIHREILNAITREDAAVIEICEDRAVAEMKGYLKARYDVAALFDPSRKKRHPLVLMFAIDIAVYHLFSLHNPQKMSQLRKDRYDRAMEWLRQVAAQKILIDGAPELDQETLAGRTPLRVSSNPKRHNHL